MSADCLAPSKRALAFICGATVLKFSCGHAHLPMVVLAVEQGIGTHDSDTHGHNNHYGGHQEQQAIHLQDGEIM